MTRMLICLGLCVAAVLALLAWLLLAVATPPSRDVAASEFLYADQGGFARLAAAPPSNLFETRARNSMMIVAGSPGASLVGPPYSTTLTLQQYLQTLGVSRRLPVQAYPIFSESIILDPATGDGPWQDHELDGWINATLGGRDAQRAWWRSRYRQE